MSVPAHLDPHPPATPSLEWTGQDSGADDPTAEMATALTRAYAVYNTHLFGDVLPPCLITLQRRSGSYGYFAAEMFKRTSPTNGMSTSHEIAMNPAHFAERSTAETLSTLVHEMVHLAQHIRGKPGRGRYHNRQWADWMIHVGLHPSHSGQPGGKETGDSMSHYIVEGGLFARVTDWLLAQGFTIPWADAQRRTTNGAGGGGDGDGDAKSGKRVKYTCPTCGLNAWAKGDASLICGFDQTPMPPAAP